MSHSAPGSYHGPGPGLPEGVVLPLPVNPLSVQGVLDPALSVLPEGIVPRDGTRGRTLDPALLLPVDGSVLSPLHRPVNAYLLPVARGVIVVAHLPAEGGTHQMTVPGHAVEALARGLASAVEALPLLDAERRASLDRLPRKVGGAKETLVLVAAALAVNLQLAEDAWIPIVVV